jgi:two-component system, NarL family, nitrate/nitrite response regulator NarL
VHVSRTCCVFRCGPAAYDNSCRRRSKLTERTSVERPAKRRGRVLIVDQHAEVRESVRSLLDGSANLDVIGQTADGNAALAECRRLRPDVVVMDVHLAGMDGLALTRVIKRDSPETSVIVLTLDGGPLTLLNALRSGADAYVLKGTSRRELLSVVRDVLHGDPPVHPSLARTLLDVLRLDSHQSLPPGSVELSETDHELLRLRALGHSYARIGRQLGVEPREVRAQMRKLIEKLASMQDSGRDGTRPG